MEKPTHPLLLQWDHTPPRHRIAILLAIDTTLSTIALAISPLALIALQATIITAITINLYLTR